MAPRRVLVLCQRKFKAGDVNCNTTVRLYEDFLRNMFGNVAVEYMTPGLRPDEAPPENMDWKMSFGSDEAWINEHRHAYDGVMIGFCPIYMFDADRPNPFGYMHEVLKPGGKLIIGPTLVRFLGARRESEGNLPMILAYTDYPDHRVFDVLQEGWYLHLVSRIEPFFEPNALFPGRVWNAR